MKSYNEVHEYIGEFVSDLEVLQDEIESNGATPRADAVLTELIEKWDNFGPELERLLAE